MSDFNKDDFSNKAFNKRPFEETTANVCCFVCGQPALTVATLTGKQAGKFIGACGKHPEVVIEQMKRTNIIRQNRRENNAKVTLAHKQFKEKPRDTLRENRKKTY